jgi:hypothetical protein
MTACYPAFPVGFSRAELGGFLTACSFVFNSRSISPIKAISFFGSFSCAATFVEGIFLPHSQPQPFAVFVEGESQFLKYHLRGFVVFCRDELCTELPDFGFEDHEVP